MNMILEINTQDIKKITAGKFVLTSKFYVA